MPQRGLVRCNSEPQGLNFFSSAQEKSVLRLKFQEPATPFSKDTGEGFAQIGQQIRGERLATIFRYKDDVQLTRKYRART
jgi:hypothetical protein